MPAATETPAPTTEPSPSGRLLDLVRKLIDYGREVAATIHQRTAADPLFASIRFGTTDLTLILAHIFRGLHRAELLETRVLRCAAQLDARRAPSRVRSADQAPAAARAVDTGLGPAHLPTPAQRAAEARRRPIGAVIADICRDLGILPSHPLWRDVRRAMIKHGGNLARLMMDVIKRPGFPAARPPAIIPPDPLRPPALRSEVPGGTGPP